MKDPICRAEPLYFSEIAGEECDGEKPHKATLEALDAIDRCSRKQVDNKILIAEFIDFVRAHNPPLLSVLGTMTGTQTEAAQKLCVTGAEVARLYRQIRELGRFFLSRKRPRHRKRCSMRRYKRLLEGDLPYVNHAL